MYNRHQLKVRAGNYMVPLTLVEADQRWFFHFQYNKPLLAEVKAMEGAKYHGFADATRVEQCIEMFGTNKVWSVKVSQRNAFQLQYLAHTDSDKDPYNRWDRKLDYIINFDRPLRDHQSLLVHNTLARHFSVWAAEMRTGKTLSAIEVMERSNTTDWWFVAPRSALYSVELEFDKWALTVQPYLLTYDAFKKEVENWEEGRPAPKGIIFDESHLLKTSTSQRSQCAQHMANAIREEHCQPQWWKYSPTDPFIICMSGSPAPKGPDDWWKQAEIAAPGFIKEGKINSFRDGLGLFDDEVSAAGWKYKRRITWLDDEDKCAKCGVHSSDHSGQNHSHIPSVNEISRLYRRLDGLTTVLFAKDCTQIPPKMFRRIRCEVKPSTIRAAKLITSSTSRAAQAQILLRELSDGFQYKKDENEAREIIRTHCPKDQVLQDILDSHIEDGRLVVYAGFQASVDNCVKVAQMLDWAVVRWDGRGQLALNPDGSTIDTDNVLKVFNNTETYPRVCFIAQSDSAGTGLNLSVANEIVYYSLTFKADSYVQSAARIDKEGMRGALITHIIHLPTDELVLNNLENKLDVQALSMGEIDRVLQEYEPIAESLEAGNHPDGNKFYHTDPSRSICPD